MDIYGWSEGNIKMEETKEVVKPKRVVSEETKEKLRQAQKNRWAKINAEKENKEEVAPGNELKDLTLTNQEVYENPPVEAGSGIVHVKVYNESKNELPKYATLGSAGIDLRSKEFNMLNPNQAVLVKTGLFVEIPAGYELQIRSKSGLALNHGIVVLNSPGTIDSDYRGEIGVILINYHPTTKYIIKAGDKIAQAVLSKVEQISWKNVESVKDLQETERADGGFGSTGK